MRELNNTQPIMEFVKRYKSNWKKKTFLRMPHSRIPLQILLLLAKNTKTLGNPLKRWHETIAGH